VGGRLAVQSGKMRIIPERLFLGGNPYCGVDRSPRKVFFDVRQKSHSSYHQPAGGWGALKALSEHLVEQGVAVKGAATLRRMNQPEGFDCPGCAWPDPKHTSSFGQRDVVFLNEREMKRRGLAAGDRVDLVTLSTDGVERGVRNFSVVGYSFPDGCCAAYYPETNPLVPLYAHDPLSFTPSAKGVPIRIVRAGASDESDSAVEDAVTRSMEPFL
jgi:hypothetical protein